MYVAAIQWDIREYMLSLSCVAVQVPAELWGGNKAHSALSDGPSVGGTSQWYLQSLANRLDTEFYANNE